MIQAATPRFAAQLRQSDHLPANAKRFVAQWQAKPEVQRLMGSTSDEVIVEVGPHPKVPEMTRFQVYIDKMQPIAHEFTVSADDLRTQVPEYLRAIVLGKQQSYEESLNEWVQKHDQAYRNRFDAQA
jgi:hypothetical protein